MLVVPRLSVITPTRDRPQLLAHCILAVKKQTLPIEHIIVSDGYDPRTANLCRHYGVTYTACREPVGDFGNTPRDIGVRRATTDLLAFWDDDNQFLPTAAENLLAAVDGVDLGIVQIEHWHRRKHYMRVIPETWEGVFKGFHIDTACFCVRRSFWQEHALTWRHANPDEPYCADHSLCERMRILGAKIKFNQTVIGTHI